MNGYKSVSIYPMSKLQKRNQNVVVVVKKIFLIFEFSKSTSNYAESSSVIG